MIVPMKKITVLVLDRERETALRQMRRLGVLHIEITEGRGERLLALRKQTEYLKETLTCLPAPPSDMPPLSADTAGALAVADAVHAYLREKSECSAALSAEEAELSRVRAWGEIDPRQLAELSAHGVGLTLYEMPPAEYKRLGDTPRTVVLARERAAVRFLAVTAEAEAAEEAELLARHALTLPEHSTETMRNTVSALRARLAAIDAALSEQARYTKSLQNAVTALEREAQLEIYRTGMDVTALSESENAVRVACLVGYAPAEDTPRLCALARENAWGILVEDPTPDDHAPTKLSNNKFVSLIYPLTDFLGTVPGYFEYDISAWFLAFILIFFGIIFGDGGYGLLILAVCGILIGRARLAKKPVPPAYLLIALMGGATVLWGVLTCTWFGVSPAVLPTFLQKLSIPVISNVYADRLWYPFWTNGEAYLTTSQNLQIVCFTLALVQLSLAHTMGMIRNRRSLKLLGDLGSILQLTGIYYVVLSLVVNSAVFGLDLVIGGFPVGTVAIASVGVGFLLSFIFSNYEGSLAQSVLTSLKGIVSSLLGVVNVFSDIVSYIRLWAVGLAGAAITATINDLVGPMLANLAFIVFAIVLLVFGHGLNMILNILSVIVHGVRLNTLEFSTHLDMSWGGHKYEPFEE